MEILSESSLAIVAGMKKNDDHAKLTQLNAKPMFSKNDDFLLF